MLALLILCQSIIQLSIILLLRWRQQSNTYFKFLKESLACQSFVTSAAVITSSWRQQQVEKALTQHLQSSCMTFFLLLLFRIFHSDGTSTSVFGSQIKATSIERSKWRRLSCILFLFCLLHTSFWRQNFSCEQKKNAEEIQYKYSTIVLYASTDGNEEQAR